MALAGGLQLTLVNPEIVTKSVETVYSEEGCLSLPGITIGINRPTWIVVSATNFKENRIFGVDLTKVTGKDFSIAIAQCVCVCHEVDHVLGRLIVDYT